VKFGTVRAKFHPHRCNASPLRGEKPQNRPLSKLNTGRFALCAMLPVKNSDAENIICNQYGEGLAILNTENIKICARITELDAIKNVICLRFHPHLQKI